MSEFFGPDKIYDNFTNNCLNKKDAADMLITFIENSDDYMLRIEALEIVEKIGLKTKKIFKILENWVVSDEMQIFRAIALKIIADLFPKKSIDTLKWVLSTIKQANEYKTHFIFATLFELVYWTHENYLSNFRKEVKEKLDPFIQSYVKEGVVLHEAVILALLEIQYGNIKIRKRELKDFLQITSNEHLYYTINDSGHIIGIYITGRILFIPQNLYELRFLEELELRGTLITSIPKSIDKLTSLKILNLGGNHIKEVPDTIGIFSELKKLNLSNNKIQEFPDAISSLISLEELDLHQNYIKSIPDSIGSLKNLTSLYLCQNKITIIPDSIASLTKLKILDLWNNNIRKLPELVGRLKSIEYLSLGHNKIQKIPNSISSLPSIKKIDLRFNNIRILPESLISPTWLKILVLEGNKIKN